jgi:DNA replicative helicase MCM subunit Mcm2 (Cdc46/Mcm family)
VLAAANPIFGRYDDLKGVGENIDLMTTILSRFDCIFIVRDVRDQERDRSIARHVLGVHVNASSNPSAGFYYKKQLMLFIEYFIIFKNSYFILNFFSIIEVEK